MGPVVDTRIGRVELVATLAVDALVRAAAGGRRDLYAATGQLAAALTVVGVLVPAAGAASGVLASVSVALLWVLAVVAGASWCGVYWGADRDELAAGWSRRAAVVRAGTGALRAEVGVDPVLRRIRRIALAMPAHEMRRTLGEAERLAAQVDLLLAQGLASGVIDLDVASGRLRSHDAVPPGEAAALWSLVQRRRHDLELLLADLGETATGGVSFTALQAAEHEVERCVADAVRAG